jgi:hypothetical protein
MVFLFMEIGGELADIPDALPLASRALSQFFTNFHKSKHYPNSLYEPKLTEYPDFYHLKQNFQLPLKAKVSPYVGIQDCLSTSSAMRH